MARDNFRENITGERLRAYDPYAHALTVITEPHRLIHDGMFFDASAVQTGITNGSTFDILIKMPAGSFGHMLLVEFAPDDTAVNIKFYEDVVTSADGTAMNTRNHNRVNANDTANAGIFTGPTVTDVGTLLHERHIPDSGGPPGRQSGQLVSGEDAEWVIGHPTNATEYLWRLTNNSGGTITCGVHLNGYEIGYEL